MRYNTKYVNIPDDMKVGEEVGVVGEGGDIFTITHIARKDGQVVYVDLSCGCQEPLCKIYLLRGRSHYNAAKDKTSWIDVSIGECDICKKKFPDACTYHQDNGVNSMVCPECHEVNKNNNLK